MSTLEFTGRVALVTGAGRGMGRATAKMFAAAGASVAVVDVDGDLGEETVAQIRSAGNSNARSFRCDVADEKQVSDTVRAITETYGRLDYAHNNAGISPPAGNTVECTKEHWDRIIGVNLTGVFLGMKYEIPAMIASGGGAIVNTASVLGLKAGPGFAAYIASKHGVSGLTKAAALEFASAGIRVNGICPGVTLTEMVEAKARIGFYDIDKLAAQTPLKRPASPDEMAHAVLWLCSSGASFITGALLPIDGGICAG